MPVWIAATLFAAFMQNLRFLLQRHLKVTRLSTGGATWARFAFAVPFVAVVVGAYGLSTGQSLPRPEGLYWAYAASGAMAQMLATACVVALFARRNFYVGIILKKSEVILTALIGFVLLGEGVSAPVIAAIAVGFAGVLVLSDPPQDSGLPWTKRVFNAASGYGLASGVLFGVSAVCYRGATLALEDGDVPMRAGMALLTATIIQTLTLGTWLAVRERGEIWRVIACWRISALTGLTSMLGSLGWFIAFALQTAAYVKALGQIELLFTFFFSAFWLREQTSRSEIIGIALIIFSLALILWSSL
ncbi:EamA family transporter [Gymnodinialimonas sp. 2305UL16-5]|uniref:EamA family transporter n=1 Tax=Gymnodinialimonas mytili TaxID=3126503 RepID=UPI0030B526A0